MTSLAWFVFNIVRYFTLDEVTYAGSLRQYLGFDVVVWGQLLMPLMMMGLYWMSGFYNNTFRKSRLEVLTSTVGSVLLGVIVIYFVAIIDDPIPDRFSNYILLLILMTLFIGSVLLGRMIITSSIMRNIAGGNLSERVAVVGDRSQVIDCLHRLSAKTYPNGLAIVGVALTDGGASIGNLENMDICNLSSECDRLGIVKVILAVKPDDSATLMSMVNRLYQLNRPLLLPAWSAGAVMSRVKMRNVAGVPLADLASVGISESGRNIKRLMDVLFSGLALVFLSPVMAAIAILVKRDSDGPAIYSQQRVGMHRVPFKIYKFRTMAVDAEADGTPRLSRDDDPRVTRLGRMLRKYRLDELPQFWNVMKGDMSLVGPRPEREYYESLIIERAPHYSLVHQLRPGITSWGMVKYGYATSVDQMVERLAYDMIYLENVSVALDLKIMFFTVRTVLTGQGV